MIARTFTNETDAANLVPADAGTRSHCRRVAAWCDELARKLRLPAADAAALVEAARLHHDPAPLKDSSLSRLMGDLGFPCDTALSEPAARPKSQLAERILHVVQGTHLVEEDATAVELARLLEAANRFDEQLEYAPFSGEDIDSYLGTEDDLPGDESVAFVLKALRVADREDLIRVMPKLPVYPAIAMRLYRLLSSNDVTLAMLEDIARADQVVAGKLVKAANSVFYSPWQPIKSVAQAISYVGTRDAQRILLASSIQPLFSTPRLRVLWKHSLEAAQVAERIAELSGVVEPSEAFLMGLLHDVGKLAIALLSRDINDAIDRLLDKGCQPAVAETVLCGFDHAQAGGEVLRFWKFSDELVSSVERHHQPERTGSAMAAVLYLTEFWTDSEEDIPSNARLHSAMKLTGLTAEALEAARMSFNSAMASI